MRTWAAGVASVPDPRLQVFRSPSSAAVPVMFVASAPSRMARALRAAVLAVAAFAAAGGVAPGGVAAQTSQTGILQGTVRTADGHIGALRVISYEDGTYRVELAFAGPGHTTF